MLGQLAVERFNARPEPGHFLPKLGKPGDTFVHDFFLPSTQLSFAEAEAQKITKVDGVDAIATGLTVQVSHQSGTVPQIVSAGQRAGVDVVMLTDHNTRAGASLEGWHGSVLLLVGAAPGWARERTLPASVEVCFSPHGCAQQAIVEAPEGPPQEGPARRAGGPVVSGGESAAVGTEAGGEGPPQARGRGGVSAQ